MALPTKHEFFVADDARAEKDDKTTLVGLYMGAEVLMAPGVPVHLPVLLPGLAVVCVLYGGFGKYQMTADLLGPDNKPVAPPMTGEVPKEKAKSLTLQFKIAPFPLHAFGKFQLTVHLQEDGQTKDYPCPFFIGEKSSGAL